MIIIILLLLLLRLMVRRLLFIIMILHITCVSLHHRRCFIVEIKTRYLPGHLAGLTCLS